MKIKINKQYITESVMERIKNEILGKENPEEVSSEPSEPSTPEPSTPSNAQEASSAGERNMFMGQKSSDSYSGNKIVRDAQASLG